MQGAISASERGEDAPAAGLNELPRLAVSPFVKWAGGKSRLLSQLQPFFPARSTYGRYFEPVLGGGAVYFHLQPGRAILSDLNGELINAYRVIRDSLPELVLSLRRHEHSAEYYYRIRALPAGGLSRVEMASRFIYLNKTCYNGLYRVNSKGRFNVPRGRYTTPPRVFDERNLSNVARLLSRAEPREGSFEEVLAGAEAGDFAYLDPPYQPLSATAYFTAYTTTSFRAADQERLAQLLHELDRRGVRFLLNNHDTPALRELYRGFTLNEAIASRAINSRADRRGGVAELIVTNYDADSGGS
ncbi:MAG: DNA adenine methylase [Chloroflexota bacterium]